MPAAAAPALASSTRTLTPFRSDSADDGRAVVAQDNGRVISAGKAGGDFGLSRDGSSTPFDLNFGDDGMVTTDFGGTDDAANAVGLGPSGTVVAAGSSSGNIAIARYDANGHLDLSFGAEGLVTTDLGAADDAAYGVVVKADGGIVVVGGGGSAAVLVGYRPDGSVDSTFGDGGRVHVDGTGPARAIIALPDGALVVASGGSGAFITSRFLATGRPDSSFGNGGVARIPLGSTASANSLAPSADGGRILLAGTADAKAVVVQLSASGLTDLSFGVAGRVNVATPGRAEAKGVTADAGGIKVVGEAEPAKGFAAAYDASGVPQTRWTPDGVAITEGPLHAVTTEGSYTYSVGTLHGDVWIRTSPGFVNDNDAATSQQIDFGSLATQAVRATRLTDGKLLLLLDMSGVVGLMRFSSDGSLDPTFGRAGRIFTDLASMPKGLVVEGSGRIVVLGERDNDLALVGFQTDGSIDRGFGTDGRSMIDPGAPARPAGLVLLPDGKLVLAGSESYRGSLLVRASADGGVDSTFGTEGFVWGTFGSYPGPSALMERQPDGKILVSVAEQGFSRVNVDGSPDTAFGASGRVPFGVSFGSFTSVTSMLVQPDGSILLGGQLSSYDDSATGVAHVSAAGVPDPAWPAVRRGQRTTPLTLGAPVSALLPLADGRLLAVGGNAVARLLPSGAFDQSFGQLGVQSLTADGGAVVGAWVMGDGSLLTVGTADRQNVVVAYNRIGLPGLSAPRAWGFNGVAQLGSGDLLDRQVPVPVSGLTNVANIAAGAFHGLALKTDGTVWAWGWNGFGEVGDGTTVNRTVPVQVAGLDHVVSIAAGAYHSLAVRTDGSVWAWGYNGFGQLGDGTTVDQHVPVLVTQVGGVRQVAAGAFHSLALSGSAIMSWGYNGFGQLGDGTTVDRHIPVPITGPNQGGYRPWPWPPATIAAGAYHSLATGSDGGVFAWGWNGFGQLGDGTTISRLEPYVVYVPFRDLKGLVAVSVSGGLAHSVAIRSDGSVWAWGWNGAGQLGDGTTVDRHVAVAVVGAGETSQVSAGWVHTLSVRTDGAVMSWGWNGYGQLGTGSTTDRHVPGPVGGLSKATVVSGAPYQSLAA